MPETRKSSRNTFRLSDFGNWFGVVDEVLRAALGVWQGDLEGVQAEVSVQRGENVFVGDRSGNCRCSKSVCFADHLSVFHSATCK